MISSLKLTVSLASSFKISFDTFSKVNKTRGEHGRPAYTHSLLIGRFNVLINSIIDGSNLFLKVSTIRKNLIHVISKSIVGFETIIICDRENSNKTALTYFVCSFSHIVKKLFRGRERERERYLDSFKEES